MKRRLSFRPEAEAEAVETQDWYENRQPELGAAFREEIERNVERILARPLMFPRVYGEVRRAVFERFPYAIYFRTIQGGILVLAVHGR